MIHINENFQKLEAGYLFAEIERRVKEYAALHPAEKIIKLGIGDVTLPLPPATIKALHEGAEEMARAETFKGYGPYEGYEFLREAIAASDYRRFGLDISPDDIFVSDGAKGDCAYFHEIFSQDIKVAIPDPVYPVYADSNVMAGRSGRAENGRYKGLIYLDSLEENDFIPNLPKEEADLIYLCFPNNPTGAAATIEQLKPFVDYAHEHKSLIFYDAAYSSFIQDGRYVRSIYQVPGAKEVAVESRSFSKSAGFTGLRCAYLVVPEECCAFDKDGVSHQLKKLWFRRQSTKFNGVSYPVQKAAAAALSPEGLKECEALVKYYLENAGKIRAFFEKMGFSCTGGINSPYIWINSGRDSWEFFDFLLNKAQVVTTPGAGFGRCGAGFIRISAFNSHEAVDEALTRLKKLF